MRNGQILVYPFSCVHCTSPMFLFLFVQHRHHRDAFGTNWGSLGLLATFTMGESPLNWLLSLPVPADFTPGSWNCRNRDVVSCSFFLPIFEKLAWNGSKLQAVLSFRMRNGQFLVYAFSCVHCTSAMFYFMFLWYPQHRHPFGANWCYLRVLATITLVENLLKSTCIIACTPGFHSMDFKLQKRGVPTMLILVAKPQQPSVNRFQDIRTFFVAHA